MVVRLDAAADGCVTITRCSGHAVSNFSSACLQWRGNRSDLKLHFMAFERISWGYMAVYSCKYHDQILGKGQLDAWMPGS
jgi:hypothetical protein